MDETSFDPEYSKESHAARIIGVVTFFHSVALTVVACRIYVRTWLVRSFGVDDAIIVIAVVRLQLSRSDPTHANGRSYWPWYRGYV